MKGLRKWKIRQGKGKSGRNLKTGLAGVKEVEEEEEVGEGGKKKLKASFKKGMRIGKG